MMWLCAIVTYPSCTVVFGQLHPNEVLLLRLLLCDGPASLGPPSLALLRSPFLRVERAFESLTLLFAAPTLFFLFLIMSFLLFDLLLPLPLFLLLLLPVRDSDGGSDELSLPLSLLSLPLSLSLL